MTVPVRGYLSFIFALSTFLNSNPDKPVLITSATEVRIDFGIKPASLLDQGIVCVYVVAFWSCYSKMKINSTLFVHV